ncbi:YheC/YheD family protein [Paenibacillus yanchengensis]|uniref:YheC/YheD family protein n=1 Tax=Paenibacillus yanchengensis TaxID=2035833 RepID=A0ABW4YLD2_9BACL
MATPRLGILTLYMNDQRTLEEKPVYEKMTVAGQQMGIDIFVFTPDDVNYSKDRIHALFYNTHKKTWRRQWTTFPNAIYDRCRLQKSERFQRLQKFRRHYGNVTFLNRPLRNKWTIHNAFMKEPKFRSFMPSTKLVNHLSDIIQMLQKFPIIYLKPISGTGGRGIIRIEKRRNGLLYIQGRNQQRGIITPRQITLSSLGAFLSTWNLRSTRYIVQQGLDLKLNNGLVHDYRMLVQKNGLGEWKVTGCAGRVGAKGSITSNLHGGGKAIPMNELLRIWFKDDFKLEAIKQQINWFGEEAAKYLEKTYGSLCELAFDLAIDKDGKIWMIEVNPKPAREVFIRAGEHAVYEQAIAKPLEYALWLLQK